MKRSVYIIVLVMMAAISGSGQSSWAVKRDSLLKSLSRARDDTFKVWTLLRLGNLYLNNQNDSAAYYAKAFGQLSEKLNYDIGKAYSLSMQAVVLSDESKLDEAIAMDIRAINILKDTRRRTVLANLYNNLAVVYGAKGDEAASIDAYLHAEGIYEEMNDSSNMAMVYGNLGSVYVVLREYDKAYAYSLKGILLKRSLGEGDDTRAAMINLGSALVNLQRFDTALVVLNQVREMEKMTRGNGTNPTILCLMGVAYVGLGKYDMVKSTAAELMGVAKENNDNEAMCYALSGYVDYYLHVKKYEEATHYAMEYVSVAERAKDPIQIMYAYEHAARVEMVRGNMDMGNYYNMLRDSIDDAIRSERILENTQELEAKYSLKQKQAEIDQLNQQQVIEKLTLRQRKTLIWVLAAAVLVAILVGLLYKKLQQQRITELEREKQLLAVRAVVQGQVEERTRLAKDLHDGLGSILSSAKFSFNNMKERLIITPENAAAFEKGMDMLDKSISELRRVAHNLMPEALTRFGLDTALKDFCNSVAQSGALDLNYQSFGLSEATLPDVVSSAVYRIVQELVNNILKHADATTALVQLIRNNDTLSIAVEDNGKGFDTSILNNNNGMGYLNLKNRVAYLRGTIDIQTSPGKGTSVYIEISTLEA